MSAKQACMRNAITPFSHKYYASVIQRGQLKAKSGVSVYPNYHYNVTQAVSLQFFSFTHLTILTFVGDREVSQLKPGKTMLTDHSQTKAHKRDKL